MWYLIVPPIIVVASLSLVLWYLSRKGTDPLIAGKVLRLQEEAKQQASFPRIKTFFLHLLEKAAYRFKVTSLKIHNAFHNLTHSLKERQRRFQNKSSASETPEQPAVPANISATETILKIPIARKHKETAEKGTEESLTVLRPTVSKSAVHPERGRVTTRKDSVRESDLIARISSSPRDFAAYEGLGDYYLEIGNIQDAKACYRQVLKFSPAQRMVRIKIRRLEKILSQEAK